MMSRLVVWRDACREIGVSSRQLRMLVDDKKLCCIVIPDRDTQREYITADSINAWLRAAADEDTIYERNSEYEDKFRTIDLNLLAISRDVEIMIERCGLALSRIERRIIDRRRQRLRHTVSTWMGDAFDPKGWYVYILWGDDDEVPLYIGQSRNVLSRLGSHMSDAEKRASVSRIQLIKCAGERTMMRTEAALIREFRPYLNISLVSGRSKEIKAIT